MQDYIINKDTLAIVPCAGDLSLVYEGKNMFVIYDKPNNIIKKNCLRFGSTLMGRQKSTECITGVSYKAPIIVSEYNKWVFFPTSSPRLKSVAWISLSNVDKAYYNFLKRVSVILFNNGVLLEFDVSLNIINNQIFRSMKLERFIEQKNRLNV